MAYSKRIPGIAFCVLAFLNAAIAGMAIAGKSGVADGMGLAAGAIILQWGIIAGMAAFVAAAIITALTTREWLVRINRVLLLLLLGFVFYFFLFRFQR